jgi:hypothetical protein
MTRKTARVVSDMTATVNTIEASTLAEYASYIAAGCEPLTPSEYDSRVTALGYRLDRNPRTSNAVGAYVNRANERSYSAYGVSYSIRATGDQYGRVGRWTSFANGDAPRDRLQDLQELRRNSVVMHAGRIWEL